MINVLFQEGCATCTLQVFWKKNATLQPLKEKYEACFSKSFAVEWYWMRKNVSSDIRCCWHGPMSWTSPSRKQSGPEMAEECRTSPPGASSVAATHRKWPPLHHESPAPALLRETHACQSTHNMCITKIELRLQKYQDCKKKRWVNYEVIYEHEKRN